MLDIVATLRAAGCVYAEDEARLLLAAARGDDELDAMARRRAAGEPIEHVVGWAEFCGLRIAVRPGVFVPRRRTEFLATQAIAAARSVSAGPVAAGSARVGSVAAGVCGAPVVVDLCCGAGAVAATVGHAVPGAEIHAADIDRNAVDCARQNVPGLVHLGDLFAALPAGLRGLVDVLVVNPPYVPTGDLATLPAEARDHEPRIALDGGADGLDILRRLGAAAWQWLAPGGTLLAETSERQAPAALAAVTAGGLTARLRSNPDLAATIVVARRS